jgi:hypothetical protein
MLLRAVTSTGRVLHYMHCMPPAIHRQIFVFEFECSLLPCVAGCMILQKPLATILQQLPTSWGTCYVILFSHCFDLDPGWLAVCGVTLLLLPVGVMRCSEQQFVLSEVPLMCALWGFSIVVLGVSVGSAG